MNQFIVAESEACIGCRSCEVACVTAHHQGAYPSKREYFTPRVKVIQGTHGNTAVFCHHCEDAPCANVCPTNAIEMKKLASPVKLTDSWTKTEVPELNSLKCVVCYYCHDFCPVFLLYGEKGTIHPNTVGNQEVDVSELINQPVKISDDKLKVISQYLSDKTILKNRED